MPTRRQFLMLAPALLLPLRPPPRPVSEPESRVWLPVAASFDAPIVGPASGPPERAIEWFAARCSPAYTAGDVTNIVLRYQQLGEWSGADWFLALAQMAHETGSMTSWWSQPPRNNPADIGVTGRTQPGDPGAPPGPNWAWHDEHQLWREGVSFETWIDHAVLAHLGRLLAYACADAEATPEQRALINFALEVRPLPSGYRGVAPTIVGLNGRWAVPGEGYGQRIVDLMLRMREGSPSRRFL